MNKYTLSTALLCAGLSSGSSAQQLEQYDYWAPQRAMVQRGQQAVFMCNGLFTIHRTLEQVFKQDWPSCAARSAPPKVVTTTWTGSVRRLKSVRPTQSR